MNEKEVIENTIEDRLDESPKGIKKITPKQWKLIAFVGAIVVALGVGIGIYNAPVQKVVRQLSLGYKYLENQQYEEAIVAFKSVINIDENCLEAYVAGLKAYHNVDKVEEQELFYESALVVTKNMDVNMLAQNSEYVETLYLSASDIYTDDLEKVTQTLEDGLKVTENSEKLKEELIIQYKNLIQQYTTSEKHLESLNVYDRLLELGEKNKQLLKELGISIAKSVENLIAEKKYEEARNLVNKYKEYEVQIDFAELIKYIDEQEKIELENLAFIQNVYGLMAAEDYSSMHQVDGSEEADAFVLRMMEEKYIYIPEADSKLNGVGAGVYRLENGGYYFYYGDFMDGARVGQGTIFINEMGDTYQVFAGQWQNDAPNGPGKRIITNGVFGDGTGNYYETSEGNLKEGLWDGQVKCILQNNGAIFDLSYVAKEGIPTEDKTAEFVTKIFWGPSLGEETWIYAFDMQEDTGEYVFSYTSNDNRLGVAGFRQ